jgi:hypothetical protein
MADMRVEQTLTDYPGCCNVTLTSEGPFVVTDLFIAHDGRFQPSVELVERLGEAIGLVPAERVLAAEEAAQSAQADVELMRAELERLRALERACAFTLQHGIVVDRKGNVHMRSPRGESRVELPAVEASAHVAD